MRAEPAAREPEAATRLSGRFFADPACGRYPKASRQWVLLKIRNACKALDVESRVVGFVPRGRSKRHGCPCQLERLSAPFPRLLPRRSVSCDALAGGLLTGVCSKLGISPLAA